MVTVVTPLTRLPLMTGSEEPMSTEEPGPLPPQFTSRLAALASVAS
jgi:hypothetical protein